MSWNALLPLLILLSSLIPGVMIFFVLEGSHRLRTSLNLGGAGFKLLFIAFLAAGVYRNEIYEMRFTLLPELELVLYADALSVLFATLSTVLWFLTTLYAIGYLEGSPNHSRFFGFFSLCMTSTLGVAMAGNMVTFLLFYELLTLSTYPLVVHRGTPQALRAGQVYLVYTLTGGVLLLVGVVALRALAGPLDFATTGGVLSTYGETHRHALQFIAFLLIAGLGVKAALVPLHGWLPQAMVAPAPVSALLHAVAVVKAGAFGIARVVFDLYGVGLANDLGLLAPLAGMAAVTVIYGSIRALFQDDLKRRLAYSTVSQVSYIALGIGVSGSIAATGGLVHLVHQGLMKITLFFCAGNLAETFHIHRISDMNGMGRRMPWTMGAFTIGALGMVGFPPLAGFVSKWHLGVGGIVAGETWVIAVLLVSTLLNAAYFFPILYRLWFVDTDAGTGEPFHPCKRLETHWMLLLPPLVTAILALGAGLFASTSISPLTWVRLITGGEYDL